MGKDAKMTERVNALQDRPVSSECILWPGCYPHHRDDASSPCPRCGCRSYLCSWYKRHGKGNQHRKAWKWIKQNEKQTDSRIWVLSLNKFRKHGSSVHGIFRQGYWSGLPFSTSGNLPGPGVEPASRVSPARARGFLTTSTTWEALRCYIKATELH